VVPSPLELGFHGCCGWLAVMTTDSGCRWSLLLVVA
jgi:hypothetical protein